MYAFGNVSASLVADGRKAEILATEWRSSTLSKEVDKVVDKTLFKLYAGDLDSALKAAYAQLRGNATSLNVRAWMAAHDDLSKITSELAMAITADQKMNQAITLSVEEQMFGKQQQPHEAGDLAEQKVEELRKRVATVSGLAVNKFRLVFSFKTLEDNKMTNDYKL